MTDHAITPAITLLARFAKREDAQAEWQAAADGRRDRHRLASMMVLWALQQVDPDGTCETGLAVATLHQRLLAGDPPPRAEWSRVRRAALAATDRAPRGERVVYEMAEAAAWDPSGASTVLSDTLLPWLIHVSTNAMAVCGWTGADSDAIGPFVARALEEDAEADPYRLVRAEAPELFARMEAAGAADAREIRRVAEATLAALLDATLSLPADVPLIPRVDLFGNPDRYGAQIDPTGTMLAWIAPAGNVNNIWAAPRDDLAAAYCLTRDDKRGIHSFVWAYDGATILYVQDADGDENWHVHAVTLDRATRDLTPFPGAQASIAGLSRDVPTIIAVQINARDPRFHDIYHIDLASGAATLIEQNPGFGGFVLDSRLLPQLAIAPRADGGQDVLRRGTADWELWFGFDPDDARASRIAGLSRDGATVFVIDSRDRDTAALVALPLAGGPARMLAEQPDADIEGYLSDSETDWPIAVGYTRARNTLAPIGETVRIDLERLVAADLGEFVITSRSLDDRRWTIQADRDDVPSASWLFDRDDGTLTRLFSARPWIEHVPLARTTAVTIRARDGLDLISYLTLPVDRQPDMRLPLVLLVHGGPWARDRFGYDNERQWLANRGYAVLAVNFRGSTGFGKAFLAAARGEWGAKMDDDLIDAVEWAVASGVADPARIAIMGGSYGGYAVLSGMTRSPHVYACGVDVVGPSSLETLMASIPPYWEAQRVMLYRAVGDPRTEAGAALLRERSPLHRADRIARPLLIGQGANDPRVLQSEADQMVAALHANAVPVTYVLYPDEGHGFVRPANRLSFNAVVEAFLARHLGGRFQPVSPGEFDGTTMEVREDSGGVATMPVA